jgi:hypothetical protein
MVGGYCSWKVGESRIVERTSGESRELHLRDSASQATLQGEDQENEYLDLTQTSCQGFPLVKPNWNTEIRGLIELLHR